MDTPCSGDPLGCASASAMLYLKLTAGPQETWWVPLVSLWDEGIAAILALWFFFLNFLNRMSFVLWQTMRGAF